MAGLPPLLPRKVRFGDHEFDLQSGELSNNGSSLIVPEQPRQILELLLERAGELVTRDELQRKLWPDTFVDVEHSLNAAVKRLRSALGDDADCPRYIETIPKRGYRFSAPVNVLEHQPKIMPADQAPAIEKFAKGKDSKRLLSIFSNSLNRPHRSFGIFLCLLLTVAVMTIAALFWWRSNINFTKSSDELVQILNMRAGNITYQMEQEEALAGNTAGSTTMRQLRFTHEKFDEMHKQTITALRNGNLTAAHESILNIHSLFRIRALAFANEHDAYCALRIPDAMSGKKIKELIEILTRQRRVVIYAMEREEFWVPALAMHSARQKFEERYGASIAALTGGHIFWAQRQLASICSSLDNRAYMLSHGLESAISYEIAPHPDERLNVGYAEDIYPGNQQALNPTMMGDISLLWREDNEAEARHRMAIWLRLGGHPNPGM